MFLSSIGPWRDDVTVCSSIITHLVLSLGRQLAGCQSPMTSSMAAASAPCHRLSVTPAITSPCHHQSVQRSMLSMSSVSAATKLRFKPLMFCGLCFSDADWKWFYMVSKQTNNALHSKTLSRVSSTSYTVKADQTTAARNKIRLLQRRNHAEMVLNYLSKQLGEVIFVKTLCAKKN